MDAIVCNSLSAAKRINKRYIIFNGSELLVNDVSRSSVILTIKSIKTGQHSFISCK